MELDRWLPFATLIIVASLSPGPNVLLVIANTVKSGARGAIATILGNLVALFVVALVAALGVGALLTGAPDVFAIMKLAGGAYLAWMGYRLIRNSFGAMVPLSLAEPSSGSARASMLGDATTAMLVSWSNPKSILFLSAVFPAFLDADEALWSQFGLMFVTIVGIVGTIHGGYALAAMRLRGALAGERSRRWMARVTGFSFIGFGAGLAVDSQR